MKIEITYPKTKKDKMIRKIKIHNRDLWSLDTNLAYIIHKSLVKFRKFQGQDGIGYPASFSTQIGKEEFSQEQEDIDVLTWIQCVDKMIYSFKAIIDDEILSPEHVKNFNNENEEARKRSGFDNYLDFLNSEACHVIFEKYKNLIEEHENNIKEGLELFSKHFRSLYI